MDETAFDQDRYDAKSAEELGRMLLSWAKIRPSDKVGIRDFIDALQHSSIPEAAGEVGYSITSERKTSSKKRS